MNYRLLYFASLRDAAGCAQERVSSEARDAHALYAEVSTRHGFVLPRDRIRVAVNGAFASFDSALRDGDEIAFLPPVSGG